MLVLVIFLGLILKVYCLNFLAVGDWGGVETAPYYTPEQLASVKGMDKVATALKSEFVLAVGDNIYHDGAIDENDTRFQASFENVYSPASLQTDWYVVFGNHDYRGNTTAQIEYSKHSARWKFPSNYYSKTFFNRADGATLDIIFIDTIDLSSFHDKKEGQEGFFDPLPELNKEASPLQWQWIEMKLKASKADYILVVGHYPVYSVCSHGPTQTLVKNLKPLLVEYGAHYVTGHDHCMEHMVEPDTPVNYFLTGMGDGCCYPAINKFRTPDNILKWYISKDNNPTNAVSGFTSFEVTKSSMLVKFYDQDGNVVYNVPAISPRQL